MADTKSSTLRWGIVGAGAIARQFASDIRRLPEMEIGAVCSRTPQKEFVSEFRVGVAYTSLDEMLANRTIDAVYIATPNHLHPQQAIAAIEAGKPVLIEKPVATSSADARAIFDAGRRHNVLAMEAMWTRFLPAVVAARSYVREGKIGNVERIEAELAYRKPEDATSRFFDPRSGGGASLDLGVYPVSLAMDILGFPNLVSGQWRRAATGVDMRADFVLDFGSVQAELSCGFDRDGANQFTILGSKGALVLHAPFLKAQRLRIYGGALLGMPVIGPAASAAGIFGKVLARVPIPGRSFVEYAFEGNGLQFEAVHFASLIKAGAKRSDIAPPEHSIAVLEAIESVLIQRAAN